MTKDSRKARAWTNEDIEEDSAGYVEAQRNERADEHRRKIEAREGVGKGAAVAPL